MAKKPTLRSLLGVDDNRVQVDLDLDEQVFRAPEVRAGNYQVAQPVYAKTNSMGQLADAMGKFSGPILSKYGAIQKAEEQAVADASELLTPDELKRYNNGDMEAVLESIRADEDRFDDLQRKRAIGYLENPNNNKRAYERTGQRIGGIFRSDLQANIDEYAADPDFDFQARANELAKEYGLEGLGSQAFYKSVSDTAETYGAEIQSRKVAERRKLDTAEAVGIAANSIMTGSADDFSDYFAQEKKPRTYEEQKEFYTDIVTQVSGEDYNKADALVTAYREGVNTLGNGVIEDSYADSLDLIITQAANLEIEEDRISVAKTKKEFNTANDTISAAIMLGTDIPESVEIPLSGDNSIVIDTSEVTSMSEYASAGLSAIKKLDKGVISESEVTQHILSFANIQKTESDLNRSRRAAAGVVGVVGELQDNYQAEFNGTNIYGYNREQALAKASQDQAELYDLVSSVYADNQYTTQEQKELASSKAVALFKAEKMKEHETFSNQVKDQKAQDDFDTEIGMPRDLEDTYTAAQGAYWASDEVENEDDMPDTRGMEEISLSFADATKAGVEEIRNRLPTEDEAGLNDVEFLNLIQNEASNYLDERDALFKDDINHDGKIDGITKDSEDANKIKASLPKGEQKPTTASSRITFESTAGYPEAPSNMGRRGSGGRTHYYLSSSQKAARKTNMYLAGINETTGKVSSPFNMALHYAYGARDENGVHLKENGTILEYSRYEAELYQSGKPIGTPMQKLRMGQKEIFQQQAVSFFNGETTNRAVKGKTPITIEELEAGRLRNIGFVAKDMDASSTMIIPFKLLNSYMSDAENVTDAQDLLLTRYARELGYINPDLEEAGVKEMLTTLISHQAAAYANRGFVFTEQKPKN